ncbi:PH domain-containing protein [Sphingobacterium sp. lm-10]|uniref:PH domain-containing protein n=1 Tax=Sphingobacterium sp. lm-10 TaxID=2944904 RepID=UPI00201FCE78|nr:PH domain-containing protein [Sphingobacterium sp. lm-10]MCL7989408.1 PH domain-containing protein [Sphingobacterium sp. lm-10]
MHKSIDFSKPNRLDAGGFIVEGLLSFGRILRSLALPLVFIALKSGHLFLTWQFWAILGGLVTLHFVYSYFRHRNFIFYVDEESQTFVLSSGLLNKSKVVLKFENILQVNVRQNVIQQALDLYSLEIDSAGSKEKEVHLYALSEPTALALRDYLVAKNLSETESVDGSVQHDPVVDELLFRIPNVSILLVSLFTNYKQGLLLFFTFIIGLFDAFRDFIPKLDYEGYYQDYQSQWMNFIGQLLLIFAVILLIPILINLVKYFFGYFSFSLKKNSKGDFMMNYGLFQLQQVIFNRKKIQMMTFVQNRILRLMDVGVLSLHQVNTDPQQREQGTIHIPGINTSAREAVWQLVFGRSLSEAAQQRKKPKIGMFISRMVKLTLIALATALFWYYKDGAAVGLWGICLFFMLLSLYNIIYYRSYTFKIFPDCLVKEDGVWDRKQVVLPIDRVVAITVSQTLWQRLPQTANLHISTASGEVVFRHFDRQDLVDLSNQLLYCVERE